jgi:LPPG:FO 2-phospho-L-lactate transferase
MDNESRILALAGGVGGAKLVAGLDQHLAALGDTQLDVVVNTGDDFEHLGLYIAPDLDSVTYALADLNDHERGWGMRGETWQFMQALGRIGGETWFNLGDQDLATHIERTRKLATGHSLSSATQALVENLGIRARVAPMSDQPVRTMVHTDAGTLAFQHYFVRDQCAPVVRGFDYAGAQTAQASALLCEALDAQTLRAIVICPSNPFISIDPMLAIPGVRDAILAAGVPVVAVSPIVGGAAVKGPAAKMLQELGLDVSARGIAHHYGELLSGFVIDTTDAELESALAPLPLLVTNTMMRDGDDRRRLAQEVLAFAASL